MGNVFQLLFSVKDTFSHCNLRKCSHDKLTSSHSILKFCSIMHFWLRESQLCIFAEVARLCSPSSPLSSFRPQLQQSFQRPYFCPNSWFGAGINLNERQISLCRPLPVIVSIRHFLANWLRPESIASRATYHAAILGPSQSHFWPRLKCPQHMRRSLSTLMHGSWQMKLCSCEQFLEVGYNKK